MSNNQKKSPYLLNENFIFGKMKLIVIFTLFLGKMMNRLHPLCRKYIFGKITWGRVRPSPPRLFRVKRFTVCHLTFSFSFSFFGEREKRCGEGAQNNERLKSVAISYSFSSFTYIKFITQVNKTEP